MKKFKATKMLSLLMALLLALQLVPMSTALANDEEAELESGGGEYIDLSEGDLALAPEPAPAPEAMGGMEVDGATPETPEDGEEVGKLLADVGLFSDGGTSGPRTNITDTEYLDIHGRGHATYPTKVSITVDGSNFPPTATSPNLIYDDIPSGAKLHFSLGFSLSDGVDPNIYTHDGSEYFTFALPKGINFAPLSGSVITKGQPIADWSINADSGILTVQFRPEIAGASGVYGFIDMTGTFERIASGGENSSIKLGSETIYFNRPTTDPPPAAGKINIDKDGKYDPHTHEITWTIQVTPSGSDNIGGFKLVDTYSGNQTYVSGSFSVTPASSGALEEGVPTNGLTYTFPDPTKGAQTVTYKTKLNDGSIGKTEVFRNEAKVLNKSLTQVAITTKDVSVGSLIKKEGTDIQPDKEGRINWTVTLILPAASDGNTHVLSNAKIIDHMHKDLELIAGTMQINGADVPNGAAGEAGKYNIVDSATENTMTYTFPSNKPETGTTVTLTYSTKVKDWDNVMKNNESVTFKNSAEFEWTPEKGDGTYGPPVIIGTGTIEKTAAGKGLVKKTLAPGWEPSSRYEYGSVKNGDHLKWKVVVNGNKVTLNNAYIQDLVGDGHELYIQGAYPLNVSVSGGGDKDYTASENNDTYGNLVIAVDNKNFSLAFPNTITETYTVEFYTKLTDTARNALYTGTLDNPQTAQFQNTVNLTHDGGTETDSATKTYTLKMLEKSTIKNYNVADHTIQWQLVVNRNKLPMAGASLSDTLEAGMEIYIDGSHKFEIEALSGGGKGELTDGGALASPTELAGTILVLKASKLGFDLTLPASTSDQFTITYWTKVTDAALKDTTVWNTNKEHAFTNQAVLISDKGPVSTEYEVTAKNPVITKKALKSNNEHKDTISWEAVVNHAGIQINNGVITDVLHSNLQLIPSSVTLQSTAINASGNPTEIKTNVPLTPNSAAPGGFTYIENTLKVYLPASTSLAYILSFDTTLVDDEDMTDITNKITLEDGTWTNEHTSTNVNINEVWSIGGMHTNSITVTKTDSADPTKPLAGARFQLFNSTGTAIKRVEGEYGGTTDVKLRDVIRVTDASGVAVFNNLPGWKFQIKEIDPPTGYVIDDGALRQVNDGANISGDIPFAATDSLGLGNVEVFKKGALSVDLDGGRFKLSGTSSYNSQPFEITDIPASAGKVSFTGIPIGTYIIEETEAPAGHKLSSQKITVTVALNMAKTGVTVSYNPSGKTITNEPTSATSTQVSFKKTDIDGASIDLAVLDGTFVLKGTDYNNNSVNKTATVAADGTVSFSDVTIVKNATKYQIFETGTPDGYLNPNVSPSTTPVLEADVQYNSTKTALVVTITKPGGTPADTDPDDGKVVLANAPAVADVTFTKLSTAETDPANPKIKINGGTFELRGKAIDGYPKESDTNDYVATATAVDGKVKFENVPVNASGESYTITEITPPSGYFATTETLTVKVSYTDATTKVAVAAPAFTGGINTLENDPIPYSPGEGMAIITKVDEDGKTLAGATFTIYDSEGKEVASMTTGADGLASFTKLKPESSYTIRETAAPEGYETSDEVFAFKTGDKTTHEFTMVNKKLPMETGRVSISKVDENGNALAGATFTLYDSANSAIMTATSGSDGMASFTNIPVGKGYTIRETAAPAGYVLSKEVFSFDISKDAVLSFSMTNVRGDVPGGVTVEGSVRLLKANIQNERLAGAEFTLYDENGNIVSVTVTGTDGIASFTNLPLGKYFVGETRAPVGYRLFEGRQSFTITNSNLNREFTLRNVKEDEDPEVEGWEDENPDDPEVEGWEDEKLPQTGGIPASFWMLMSGVILIMAGLLGFKSKDKKGKHYKNSK